MKVQEIYIDANNGFDIKLEKNAVGDRAYLTLSGHSLEITIETKFSIIENIAERLQEDIDFYRPGLKEVK